MVFSNSIVELITLALVILSIYWGYRNRKAKLPILKPLVTIPEKHKDFTHAMIDIINNREHNIYIKRLYVRQKLFGKLYAKKTEQSWHLINPNSREMVYHIESEARIVFDKPFDCLKEDCKIIVQTTGGRCTKRIKYLSNQRINV